MYRSWLDDIDAVVDGDDGVNVVVDVMHNDNDDNDGDCDFDGNSFNDDGIFGLLWLLWLLLLLLLLLVMWSVPDEWLGALIIIDGRIDDELDDGG